MGKKCVRKPLLRAGSRNSQDPSSIQVSSPPCLLPQVKGSGLLIANHTAKTTPAWALNPGMGKVKVVSVYFALERKLESDQIGLMEEDSLLLQERSAVEEAGHQGSLCPLGSEEWRLDQLLHAYGMHHSKQRREEQRATRHAPLALGYAFPVNE